MTLGNSALNLERYMDLLSARQKLVSGNIANAATPGYQTKDIDFQFEYLLAAEGQAGAPDAVEVPGLKARNDGNNVSLDRESRLLSENAMRFNAASSLLKQHVRMLRTAIEEAKNG